jgi:hypothetical protein
MTVLAEVPEALLPECPEDLLYKLVSLLVPDVTNAEVVNAVNTLASRAVAWREAFLGRKHHPQTCALPGASPVDVLRQLRKEWISAVLWILYIRNHSS